MKYIEEDDGLTFKSRSEQRKEEEEAKKRFNEKRSKETLEEALRREKIVERIEKRIRTSIDYDRIKEYEMKKGSRVKIRKNSSYASQNSSEGEIISEFDSRGWSSVKFDNGYKKNYRKEDLELVKPTAVDEQANKKILKRVIDESFDEFKAYLAGEVISALKNDKAKYSDEFKVGDWVVMNGKTNNMCRITKAGMIGVISKEEEDDMYEVDFGPSIINQIRGKYLYHINKAGMDHLTLKEVAQRQGGFQKYATKLIDEELSDIK